MWCRAADRAGPMFWGINCLGRKSHILSLSHQKAPAPTSLPSPAPSLPPRAQPLVKAPFPPASLALGFAG